MSRSAPSPGVSPAMIRHFAVLTIVCTGLLAMFLSGGEDTAIGQTYEQAQDKAALQAAEAKPDKKEAKKQAFAMRDARASSWAPETGGGGMGELDPEGLDKPEGPALGRTVSRNPAPIYSPETIAKLGLPEEDRLRLARAAMKRPSAADIKRLDEQSSRRSGNVSDD